MVTLGYHGTSGAAAQQILAEGFRASKNDYDWLGDGSYFFEDGLELAWHRTDKHYVSDPAVLEARISLADCVDLKAQPEWAWFLADVHDRFVETTRREGLTLPRQTTGAHRLDRAVINLAADILAREGHEIRSVRAVFAEGAPAFPGSFLLDRSQVQIAVRDPGVISDIRLVDRPQSDHLQLGRRR